MSINPDSVLRGIEDEEAANSRQAAEFMAMLHGWLAAGGRAPTWSRSPVGTARFLGRYRQYRGQVPHAERYATAARRILSAQGDEYASIKQVAQIRRDVEEYLRGARRDL